MSTTRTRIASASRPSDPRCAFAGRAVSESRRGSSAGPSGGRPCTGAAGGCGASGGAVAPGAAGDGAVAMSGRAQVITRPAVWAPSRARRAPRTTTARTRARSRTRTRRNQRGSMRGSYTDLCRWSSRRERSGRLASIPGDTGPSPPGRVRTEPSMLVQRDNGRGVAAAATRVLVLGAAPDGDRAAALRAMLAPAAGAGRIVVSGLGVTTEALRHPQLATVLRRGLLACRAETRDLGVGLLGYGPLGGMGFSHGLAVSATAGMALATVCDTVPARCEAARADFPGVRTVDTVADLAADPGVDVVIIATPPA